MSWKNLMLLLFFGGVLGVGCAVQHQISLEVRPQEGGGVQGAGTYRHGSTVTVVAEPSEGYVFEGWEKEGQRVSSQESYEFVIEKDQKLVALFRRKPEEFVDVELYFASPEAVRTGRAGPFGYVIPVQRQVKLFEEPEKLLREALEALIQGPAAGDETVLPVVHESLEIMEVQIADGVATVHVSRKMFGEGWGGGSLQGTVFTQAFVRTAAQFRTVDRLMVQVEGKLWEDGHRVWDGPLSPDDL